MDSRTYWRNLSWDLNILGYRHLPLLEWALQVDVGDLLAQICPGIDQSDQAVLDLQHDVWLVVAIDLDILKELALSFDGEGGPAETLDFSIASRRLAPHCQGQRGSLRNRRIGSQVDLLDDQDVAVMARLAVLQRVVAGNLGGAVDSLLGFMSEER
jgi:hypothetical protein